MSSVKRVILNVIAWVAFVVGIFMILWKVFGNSPSVAEILVPFVVFSLMKIWDNSERILGVGHRVDILAVNMRNSFEKVGVDMKRIGNRIGRIENKIDGLVKNG